MSSVLLIFDVKNKFGVNLLKLTPIFTSIVINLDFVALMTVV